MHTAATDYIDHAVSHTSTLDANKGEQVSLFLRERDGTADGQQRRAVLMLHGRSVPALAGFDLGTGDYNWALYLAQAGFDVFVMDLQGSGRSTRPQVMDDPRNVNPVQQYPLVPKTLPALSPAAYPKSLNDSASDWAEVDRAVRYIRRLRGVDKVALVGWSAAAFQLGPYAMQNPDLVSSLLLLAPMFPPQRRTPVPQTLPVTTPCAVYGFPMNVITRESFREAWDREQRCRGQREDDIVDTVWQAILDEDPVGRTWGPGVSRWRNAYWWGWNDQVVRGDTTLGTEVPVLLVYGEHDTAANTSESAGELLYFSVTRLYDAIQGRRKLMYRMQCTGHFMVWERQFRELRKLSKEWLEQNMVDGNEAGTFFVDVNGNRTPTEFPAG